MTIHRRPALFWSLLGLLMAGLTLHALAAGRYPVPPTRVLAILAAPLFDIVPDWSPTERMVVLVVRLPRVLMAIVTGAGLALCGAALQGVFRNPLVGPQTIGMSAGASLGGVAAILAFGFGPAVTFGAFAGAAGALGAVLAMQPRGRVAPVLTLVLAGIVIGAFCSAVVGFITFIADPETKLPALVFWLLGSLATASWPGLALATTCTVAAGSVVLAMRWRINLLSLGDDEARALGCAPGRDRLILLAAVCVIVAAQVAISGVIGWVGLVVPNLARLLVGADHRRLLPASLLIGASFMLVADTIARDLTAAEIPVGIVTAVVGTPVFALLLHRAAARGRTA
jgi:iron complex transport system permease protein